MNTSNYHYDFTTQNIYFCRPIVRSINDDFYLSHCELFHQICFHFEHVDRVCFDRDHHDTNVENDTPADTASKITATTNSVSFTFILLVPLDQIVLVSPKYR